MEIEVQNAKYSTHDERGDHGEQDPEPDQSDVSSRPCQVSVMLPGLSMSQASPSARAMRTR